MAGKTHGGQGNSPKQKPNHTTATSQGTISPGATKIVTGSTSSHTGVNVQSKLRAQNGEPMPGGKHR